MCPLELYPFSGLKLDLVSFVKKKKNLKTQNRHMVRRMEQVLD